MELNDLKIRQLIFEVRYNDAFLLWDCAGQITKELTKVWPGTVLEEVAPNQQALKSDSVSVITGINSSRVMLVQPSTIVQYADQISETLKVWAKFLEITEFSRVGTRVIYSRAYDSEESANRAIVELGIVNYPAAPFFNHKEPPFAAEVRLLWRDDISQTQILIKAERHQLEIAGLPDNLLEREVRVSDHVLLDIDRATRGVVDITKFRVAEWLSGVRHLVSRDISKLFKSS